MAEIAVTRANETRVWQEVSMEHLFLCKPIVKRMFAGVAAQIIRAKMQQKSNDRGAQLPGAADRLDEYTLKNKTSSHAEICEDVGGAIRGESVSANRLHKFEKSYLVPEAETAGAGAADACWSRLSVYFFPAKKTLVNNFEPSSSFLVE